MNENLIALLALKATRDKGWLDRQLFAELIIRECIAQCDDENSQQYIMAHFGVKESDWS